MFYARPARVAYYSDSANDSSFRYRCYAMADTLNEPTSVSASWFHGADGPVLEEVFVDSSVVVIHRSHYSADLDHLIGLARRHGVPVLFDCDDLMFEPELLPLVMSTLAQPMAGAPDVVWNTWFPLFARLRSTALLCDGFIGSTAQLDAEAETSLGLPGRVVPNFLTRDQLEYSDDLVRARAATGFARDGRFTIGYFSGTPTHVKDIALTSGALRELLAKRRDVKVRLVGYMTAEQAGLGGFERQVEELGYTDYVNLQRLIAETELTIAPLQDNRFTRCKSELKWFDPAAVAVPTLVSPTASMTAAVRDGVGAIVVPPGGGGGALADGIGNYQDNGRRIGEAARAAVAARQEPTRLARTILDGLGLDADVEPASD